MKRSVVTLVFVVAMAFGGAGVAKAELVDPFVSGELSSREDVFLFGFTMNEPGRVTTSISAIGFDPILALWDLSGHLMYQNDDSGEDLNFRVVPSWERILFSGKGKQPLMEEVYTFGTRPE